MNLRIGDSMERMTDEEILDLHNACLLAQEEMIREYRHVAVEVPEGRPQIRYSERCSEWTASTGHS